MIGNNIKKYRQKKGMSQEELAVKLHVVRQTVSKWENALSVPDADVLIRMAELLEVPVSVLLGTEVEPHDVEKMTEELEVLNEQIAELKQKEMREKRAGEKRGSILFLSFLTMLVSIVIKKPTVSILLSGGCITAALFILYRNLELLTSVTTEDMRSKILKITTVFNGVILGIGMIAAALAAFDLLPSSEYGEKIFAMLLVGCIIMFSGIVSPRLPFTRHTGLRLPWTIRDEETWNVAHRVIGVISFPIVFLYVGCSLTIQDFERVTVIAVLAWIGIPAVISYQFYYRKM